MPTAGIAPLSSAELAHFVREGFVVRHRALDPELCAKARGRYWSANLSASLSQDNPATWKVLPEAERVSDPAGMNDRTGQGWRLRELSGDEALLDLLPRAIFPLFEQLLGERNVVEPVATSTADSPDPRGTRLRGWPLWGGYELRGLYGNLSQERTASSPSFVTAARAGAHVDPMPAHLIASALIADVAPDGGGMALFPGTHRALYDADNRVGDVSSAHTCVAAHTAPKSREPGIVLTI
jgi:hypothetical protein